MPKHTKKDRRQQDNRPKDVMQTAGERPTRHANGWRTSGMSCKWLENVQDVMQMAGERPGRHANDCSTSHSI